MRRLPIYFLVDISESMIGEPIEQMELGLAQIIQTLKADPYAMETVYVSIIVFAGEARTLVPLQEIIAFYPPKFPIGGGTSLGKGLGHLMYELRRNLVKTTAEVKGDWKPIVFLFTDGVPTDDSTAAIAEWKQHWARTANMVAVSFGAETDTHMLGQLTENVLHFKNTDTAAYKQFFRWVTDSIKTSSESVENNGTGFELTRTDGDTLSKIDLTKAKPAPPRVDTNYVVLNGKCQRNSRPYLMKFRRDTMPANVGGLEMETLIYRFVGAYNVDNSYYELTDERGTASTVNTEELRGVPTCPVCGNQCAFAVCSCTKIHCVGDEEISTCPWCGAEGRYGVGDGSGIDINRTQG